MSAAFPDRNALINASCATCAVAIASILVFHPWMRDQVFPGTAVLAPTWALVVSCLHAGTVFADAIRSIIGAVVGAGFGLGAFSLAELFPIDSSSQHVVASLLVVPFAFVICLADPIVGSPLVHWMKPDVAALSLYIVAAFPKLSGSTYCLNTIIAFSFGSVSAMIVAGLLRITTDVGSTKRRLAESLSRFRAAQTHWLEGLTAFMASATGDHSEELDQRQMYALAALSDFQQSLSLAKVSDPLSVLQHPESASDLSVTAVLMHSQLLAFRGTISQSCYREDSRRVVFQPISELFEQTRMTVVLALRPTTRQRVRSAAHLGLKQHAADLYKALITNATATATNRHSDLPEGSEVVRLHFAVVSLIRFTLLVNRFLDTMEAATVLHGPLTSMGLFLRDKWRCLISRGGWKRTSNLAHAYRSVIAQQLISQVALFIARVDPKNFGPYILWCQLPVVFCFLPTFGGSVIKGSRRVLGTLAGGAVGCLTALANAGSETSFWLEMIIIAFIGKLLSYNPSVGYAGVVFSFTWFICMLASITVFDTSLLLTGVFYRMVLTVGGVIASYLLSALLFPAFSATELRRSMGKSIVKSTNLVVESIRGIILGSPFEAPETGAGSSATTTVESFKGAGDKALKSLHRDIVALPTLCQESKAEISFIKNFCCVEERSPCVRVLIETEAALHRFIDAVLVMTATAAATRICEYSHSMFFTEQVIVALKNFADKAELAGTKLASILNGDTYSLDDCYVGDRLDDVDRNLMAVRRILGQARKLQDAVKGGSPLIYVFHFALCELSDRWDDLIRSLESIPETLASKPERFRRESSSMSSLNIC